MCDCQIPDDNDINNNNSELAGKKFYSSNHLLPLMVYNQCRAQLDSEQFGQFDEQFVREC